MNRPRAISALLWPSLLLLPALAQEGRVIVEKPGARELRRTAHRLHIPPDQLKNARAALQEATDLARRTDPLAINSFGEIGDAWIQLDRTKAPGAIDSLYAYLRTVAGKASDAGPYQQVTFAAQQLMFALSNLDPDKAASLVRQWPDPPSSPGDDAAKPRNPMETQFRSQMAQRIAYRDPGAALKLLPALNPSGSPDYGIRGQLAMQLLRTGQKDEALKIADQVMADFQQRTPDTRSTQEYANFLQNMSMLDPDRFQDAFSILPPILAKQTASTDMPAVTMQIGDQTLQLSGSENAILNIFRGMMGRPQLALRTLDSLPDLKAKLDQIGGLDSFLSGGAYGKGINVMYYDARRPFGSLVRPAPPTGADRDPVGSLFEELRGKADKNPGSVRSKLEDVASNPNQVDTLVNLAQRANYEDPELSPIALEVAVAHLSQVEPLQRRAGTLQNLVNAYRSCEGEVDQALLRNGFIIADELRQDEEKRNPDAAGRKRQFGSQADYLEAALVAEYARTNYDAAMRFVKSKPDDVAKMMTLMQIVQALRRQD